MKVIFECETEIRKCDCEPVDAHGIHFHYAEPDYAIALAHTQATLTGKSLLKIEQHCYMRHGEEVPDQPWIQPEIALESTLASKQEMIKLAATRHKQFMERARQLLPEHLVI